MEILSSQLKYLRQTKKIYQKDIANFLEIHTRTWQKYEEGILEPNAETLVKIADFFNVSADYLLGRTDDATPPAAHRRTPSARGDAGAKKKPPTENL